MNIRLGDELRADVNRVAAIGGLGVAEIVRLCVREALPVLERNLLRMKAEFSKLHSAADAPPQTPSTAPPANASGAPAARKHSGSLPKRSRRASEATNRTTQS